MNEIIPPENNGNNRNGDNRTNQFLIGHLHYHANDLTELRRIAEVDPSLAHKVVDQRESESARVVGGYKFGIATAGTLLALTLIVVATLIILTGIMTALVSCVAIMACAVFMRVVLTGEWSDTSWFGKAINAAQRSLGGAPKKDDAE